MNSSVQASADAPLGILLVNLGSPTAPTPAAVRRFLAEFLADPRVVELPRTVWLPLLHGVVLRTRPRRSAAAYAKIWSEQGSPLLVISQRQAQALQLRLTQLLGRPVELALGMRYGQPSIAQALDQLERTGAERVLVLPLYPQYSSTTTASVFDAVAAALRERRRVPALRLVRDYHLEPAYLDALADSVREHWQRVGRGELLLMSFHGLPQRNVDLGDPYAEQCLATAEALADRLGLTPAQWRASFQSRFGPSRWLQPYTDATLTSLAREGVRRVDLICPGFAADCLETLEENAIGNRELFLAAGGEALNCVPCLNDEPDHIEALAGLIRRELGGWL